MEILISIKNKQIIYSPTEKVRVSVDPIRFTKLSNNLNNEEVSRFTRKNRTFVLAEIEASDLLIGQSILDSNNQYLGYRIK